jgi:predicted transcriptional regulator
MASKTLDRPDVIRLIAGPWISQSIYVIAKLGIFDLLEKEAYYQPIAQKVGAQPEVLLRILQALVSEGLLEQLDNERFALTSSGRLLTSDVHGGLRNLAILWGEEFYHSWGSLLSTVETGETAFDSVHGASLFAYLQTRPEVAQRFNKTMTELANVFYPAIVASYDFSTSTQLVDVAGGCGTLLGIILKANPHLKGTLFDLPHVVEQAPAVLASYGVADRCTRVAGSFFESVPSGGDTYILSNIIHDWDNDRAVEILKNCRAAITSTGKLLLVEMVLATEEEPQLARMTDLNMLVLTGGRERTRSDFSQLLERSGFTLQRIVPVGDMTCIVEAIPN